MKSAALFFYSELYHRQFSYVQNTFEIKKSQYVHSNILLTVTSHIQLSFIYLFLINLFI